jgi:hypothetical protein
MVRYTHVSRVNTAAKDAVKKEWKIVATPGVEAPQSIEELIEFAKRPEMSKMVTAVVNEQIDEEQAIALGYPNAAKFKVELPMICKLVLDSIKLITNGKATSKVRSGETVDVDGTFALIVADAEFTTVWKDKFMTALVQGKAAKKALAEEYLASQDAE